MESVCRRVTSFRSIWVFELLVENGYKRYLFYFWKRFLVLLRGHSNRMIDIFIFLIYSTHTQQYYYCCVHTVSQSTVMHQRVHKMTKKKKSKIYIYIMKKPRSTFFLIKTVLPQRTMTTGQEGRYCYKSCTYRIKKVGLHQCTFVCDKRMRSKGSTRIYHEMEGAVNFLVQRLLTSFTDYISSACMYVCTVRLKVCSRSPVAQMSNVNRLSVFRAPYCFETQRTV